MYQKLFKIGQKKVSINNKQQQNLHLNLKCKLTLFDQFGAHNFQYREKKIIHKNIITEAYANLYYVMCVLLPLSKSI